jgi:hypothetical protein
MDARKLANVLLGLQIFAVAIALSWWQSFYGDLKRH